MLTHFTYKIVGVKRGKVPSGRSIEHTLSDDKNFRKTLALDFAESAGTLWARIDVHDLTLALLTHPVECITISDLDTSVRDIIDLNLKKHPAYLGMFEVDCGNPVMLSLAVDLLPPDYRFDRGLLQVKPIEYGEDPGRPSWSLNLTFKAVEAASGGSGTIPRVQLSARGKQSLRLVTDRGKPRHSEKVLDALLKEWDKDSPEITEEAVSFGAAEQGLPIVDVRKLIEYALNEEHPKGRHKAILFRKLLGITKDDWRFLAEQLVAGLPREMVEGPRRSEYGVQYHVDVPVVGRNGATRLVRAAWKIPSGQPPFLTSVFIPKHADTELPAALTGKIIVEKGEKDWQKIYDAAHGAGLEAEANWIPTPMFVSVGLGEPVVSYVESEGECGIAWVSLNGRCGFARWLRKRGLSSPGYPSGVWILSNTSSQSVERALRYCEAFATILRAQGIECEVHSRLT